MVGLFHRGPCRSQPSKACTTQVRQLPVRQMRSLTSVGARENASLDCLEVACWSQAQSLHATRGRPTSLEDTKAFTLH